jgi:hypothetical protein
MDGCRQSIQKQTDDPSPAVVAQRLCDLLQTFPCAAAGGVQWLILVRKYEQRHSTTLNLSGLGYDTALAAASSLLWDVLRVVNAEDVDNPVVAVEEGVALTPRPGYLSTWPSLYESMCEVVRSHGVVDHTNAASVDVAELPRFVLLSQLKPLLQSKWHANFSECGVNYLSEEGSYVQIKKMKHLVAAVLRWRSEYFERRQSTSCDSRTSRCTALDAALKSGHLDLIPSKKHNDLMLRYLTQDGMTSTRLEHTEVEHETPPQVRKQVIQRKGSLRSSASSSTRWCDVDVSETDDLWSDAEVKSCSTPATVSSTNDSYEAELEREAAKLRAENTSLREAHLQLQQKAMTFNELFGTPRRSSLVSEPDLFDDPFEPPPECGSQWGESSASSTTIGTPISAQSGSATPSVVQESAGPMMNLHGQICAFMAVPMWMERTEIPCGIVQKAKTFFESSDSAECTAPTNIPVHGIVRRAKSLFEKTDEAIPSFFARSNTGFFMRP